MSGLFWMWLVARAAALAVVVGVAIGSARAGDLPVVVTEAEQESWAVVVDLLEKCVSSATLRGDGAVCRSVYAFTVGFAAKVAAQVEAAKKAKAEAERGAKESEKK